MKLIRMGKIKNILRFLKIFIIAKYIVNFLLYLIVIIYSVEILLFLFSFDIQKSLVNIKGKRIEIAKKNNLTFDPRESEVVFFEKRKKIQDLSVPFYYSLLFSNSKVFKEAKKKNIFIPFRGPINKKTLSCAEDLNYRIIENDKYGFKNSNLIYNEKIDAILLGGSHAEGFCYTSENDIAGNLIKENINTLNLGVATAGPLVSLAVLKEFGPIYKPKNVVYLYYESNNLEILEWEKKDKDLTKYLEKKYTNNYTERIDEINKFLQLIEKETIEKVRVKAEQPEVINVNAVDVYIENAQDILELNILRNKFKNFFLTKKNVYDLSSFYEVINEMQDTTNRFDGKFTFVYIPSWDRFFNNASNLYSVINLRETIIENLKNKNIETIDLTNFFNESENLSNYYPLGYVGHFNEKGYRKIAEVIKERISN